MFFFYRQLPQATPVTGASRDVATPAIHNDFLQRRLMNYKIKIQRIMQDNSCWLSRRFAGLVSCKAA